MANGVCLVLPIITVILGLPIARSPGHLFSLTFLCSHNERQCFLLMSKEVVIPDTEGYSKGRSRLAIGTMHGGTADKTQLMTHVSAL